MFGGTFDPIHIGHLLVAQDVAEALELDRVLFVPAGTPPHRPRHEPAPADVRLRMVESAVAQEPGFQASSMEVRRSGPSYTVDTLAALHEELPDTELYFLMGVDQWKALGTWREPETIARLATLVVMARAGEDLGDAGPSLSGDGRATVKTVDVTRVDLSATALRRRIRPGLSLRYRVPDGAHRIIVEEGLYR